ncbi:hypothetical protein T484DRAFT_2708404 [Baffinella frigidus]|nr:hypothetical protein T484DRAFT_2708404 [Cryptophyta sp. CCMP2293]
MRRGLAAIAALAALSSISPTVAFTPSHPRLSLFSGLAQSTPHSRPCPRMCAAPSTSERDEARLMTKGFSRRSIVAGIIAGPLLLSERASGMERVAQVELEPAEVLADPQLAPPIPSGYTGALPSADMKPEQVVQAILQGLRKIDDPVENYGLLTVLAFSTLQFPFGRMPLTRFRQIMDLSAYRVLRGNYNRVEVIAREQFQKNDREISFLDTRLFASREKLEQVGVKPKYISSKGGETFCNLRWDIRRSKNKAGDPWRMQGVFFLRTEDMGEFASSARSQGLRVQVCGKSRTRRFVPWY